MTATAGAIMLAVEKLVATKSALFLQLPQTAFDPPPHPRFAVVNCKVFQRMHETLEQICSILYFCCDLQYFYYVFAVFLICFCYVY